MKEKLVNYRFRGESLDLIEKINTLAGDFYVKGYPLTFSQLYYRLVHNGVLPNDKASYDKLAFAANRGRTAGLIDWDYITGGFGNYLNCSGGERLSVPNIHVDWWKYQEYRPEIWVEKNSVLHTIYEVAEAWGIDMLHTGGFISSGELWKASKRFKNDKRSPIIFYCGDHDPSGLDMSRDIETRLYSYGMDVDVRRSALNIEDIERLKLPSNPVKESDTRHRDYVSQFGRESWEIDSISPVELSASITKQIAGILNMAGFEDAQQESC